MMGIDKYKRPVIHSTFEFQYSCFSSWIRQLRDGFHTESPRMFRMIPPHVPPPPHVSPAAFIFRVQFPTYNTNQAFWRKCWTVYDNYYKKRKQLSVCYAAKRWSQTLRCITACVMQHMCQSKPFYNSLFLSEWYLASLTQPTYYFHFVTRILLV